MKGIKLVHIAILIASTDKTPAITGFKILWSSLDLTIVTLLET